MRSLRTRITFMTLLIISVTVIAITFSCVFFIQKNEHRRSDQILLLLCETGERNLDYYFDSVQKAVAKVSSYAETDLLDGLDDTNLSKHMDNVEKYFDIMAHRTNGVLTYYYRIDPEISKTVKGFWYTNLDGNGFVPHEVTDITLYDTNDTSSLVWFTVPKFKKEPIWIPPYITDNLDVKVISYNVPIFWRGTFVGVIGIEIDYSTMAEQVDSIRLYDNGYAFLNDSEGNLFYHPRIDVSSVKAEDMPATPDRVLSKSTFIEYTFNGEKREAAWLPLSNGMRLNVTVPVSETKGDWKRLIWNILVLAVEIFAVATVLVMFYTRKITKPLEELTYAAKQVDNGNYDFELKYNGDDEVGRLTATFRSLAEHMHTHISDLNKRAYVDALTSVRNKGAYSTYIDELQTKLDADGSHIKFAIGMFDCDDLKLINDEYGHEKGDMYLKLSSQLICKAFRHSPVFRIGGDEFSVILQNDDYRNIDALIVNFCRSIDELCQAAKNPWEKVHVSYGIAVYDQRNDHSVADVSRRADKIMYENKRIQKAARNAEAR